MTDPFEIQRVPLGLQYVLNLFGPGTPPKLGGELIGVIDLLQFYGLNQRTILNGSNAALAEGGNISVLTPSTNWSILYALTGAVTKTATLTALNLQLQVGRGGAAPVTYANQEFQRFGATETGTVNICYVPAWPLLLPPAADLRLVPGIIGTDANVNAALQAEIGLFG